MKRFKRSKKSNMLCFAGFFLLMLTVFSMSSNALPINMDIVDSYTYTNDGEAVEAPDAYYARISLNYLSLDVSTSFKPEDIFVDKNKNIYILDSENAEIIVLDQSFKKQKVIKDIIDGETGEPITFNKPEGIYVDKDGIVFVCDTENKRIVAFSSETLKTVALFNDPGITVMSESLSFYPRKLVVDKTGRMYVVARNINRGLVELDSSGGFNGFLGAPRVVPNMLELFWRAISTKEQKNRMEKFVPTEYNNVAIDDSGFVYGTIGTLDEDSIKGIIKTKNKDGKVAPVKKLNPSGDDILRRRGFFAPLGDLSYDKQGPSVITDTAVHESGRYSLLDKRRGRIFTYDSDGHLLYIFGGLGNRDGQFMDPSAIVYLDDHILVSDRVTASVTIFEITAYGKAINEAIALNENGDFDLSAEKWEEALSYNSNLYIAYVGLGKNELRKENYSAAMTYLKVADEEFYYSKAYQASRKDFMDKYFSVIVISAAAALAAGVTVFLIVRKKRKRRSRK